MMRLYPRHGATLVDAPEGHFEAADDGGFDLPGPLADRLHSTHHGGQQVWETEIERQHRAIQEEAARRSDPRTLLEVVEQLLQAAHASGAASTAKPAPAPAPAKAAPAKAAAPAASK